MAKVRPAVGGADAKPDMKSNPAACVRHLAHERAPAMTKRSNQYRDLETVRGSRTARQRWQSLSLGGGANRGAAEGMSRSAQIYARNRRAPRSGRGGRGRGMRRPAAGAKGDILEHRPCAGSDPMAAGLIIGSARAIILGRSAVGSCPFVRVVPADQTPRRCTNEPMMARIVAGSASDHGALEATFGRGGRGGQRNCQQDTQEESRSHHHPLSRSVDALR
jgi:hypothetical protein